MSFRVGGMWLCCILFFMRVVGQIMAGIYAPFWLPPMDAWFSGLLPYPVLLPTQVLLLMVMAVITTQQTLAGDSLQQSRPVLASWLRRAACLYAGAMAMRYLIALQITEPQSWHDGGLIPITFHWVLAGYLGLLAGSARQKQLIKQ